MLQKQKWLFSPTSQFAPHSNQLHMFHNNASILSIPLTACVTKKNPNPVSSIISQLVSEKMKGHICKIIPKEIKLGEGMVGGYQF